MKVIMRLNAESSSRPLTPSPLCEGGGEWQSVPLLYLRVTKRTSVMFSESKVISAPPPLLKGGEGVRGREGTLGNSRKASMFARNGSGCPQWAMIINE